jgi:hypothetical protein
VESVPRGAIRNQEAYERGKNLDHSRWQLDGNVVRSITPMDIDFVVDAAGWVLFCELESRAMQWEQLRPGPRRLYESCVRDSLKHCAVLAHHSVPLFDGRRIDTWNDIDAFQVMLFWNGRLRLTRLFAGNVVWQRFANAWLDDPVAARLRCYVEAAR